MMQMPCSSPLVPSPEKRRFEYPSEHPPADADNQEEESTAKAPAEEERAEETETNTLVEETESTTGSTTGDAYYDRYDRYDRAEAEDEYNMMSGGSDEVVQVFEDADDESDEMRRAMDMHHQHQQQYYQQQHTGSDQDAIIEQYRIDEEENSTFTSDRMSSTNSTVELITVERWTVSNGEHHRHHPASLTITSGRKYADVQMRQTQSGVSSMSTNHFLQPITKVPVTASGTNEQESDYSTPWADPSNAGVQSAGRLVQEIYDQIMYHDFPASNETKAPPRELEQPSLVTMDNTKEATPKSKGPKKTKVSSQRHDATSPLHVQNHVNSFDTEESNSNMSKGDVDVHRLGSPRQFKRQGQAQAHSFYEHLQKQPESKMGHVALGTLCSWTLDIVQPLPAFTIETTNGASSRPEPMHTQDLPKTPTPATMTPKAQTPKNNVTPKGFGNNNNPAEKKWKLKSYFKKKKKPVSGTSAEIVVNRDAVPSVPNNVSALTRNTDDSPTSRPDSKSSKGGLTISVPSSTDWGVEDDRTDGSTHPRHNDSGVRYPEAGKSPVAPPAVVMPTTARLQMFGSEYARFLSTSALAPRIKSPRLPSKSASSRYGPFATTKRRVPTSNISTGIQQIMSTSSFGSGRSKNKTINSSWNLEDQDNAILTGAIVDICITNGADTPPPKGYYRISQTVDGEEFKGALRAGGGAQSPRRKSSTYINVKKEPNWHRAAQRPCVTALTVIFPDRQEFVPPGFCVVREHRKCQALTHQAKHSGNISAPNGSKNNGGKSENDSTFKDQPANFNSSHTGGERIFLCFRRSREGNPITGILPLQPSFSEAIPDGFTVLERSPRNFVANLNPKSSSPVFLAYRQRLANLEPLRPMPLLLSVPTTSNDEENSQASVGSVKSAAKSNKKPKLSAYYCTGGTVVESNVGRYHVMDRSTHDLLSPSSVANRLSLIEISRRKTMPQLAGELNAIPVNANQRARDPSANKQDIPPQKGFNKGYDTPVRLLTDAVPSSEDSASSVDKFSISDPNVSFGNCSSIAEYPKNANSSFSSKDSSHSLGTDDEGGVPAIILSSFPASNHHGEGYYQKLYDPQLQANHDALNFIPVVETASRPSHFETQRLLRARTALLTPVLTACYQRHGGAALKAVEGLTQILRETDFFADDVDVSSKRCSTRLTLMDVAVQVVCDVATGGAQETTFGACVEFVEHAIKYTQGHLTTRTMGYVLRFYLFVFYFGASVPANKTFPHASWASPRNYQVGVVNPMPILYDPRIEENMPYLPGGAPQQAVLAFKELVTFTIYRLQQLCLNVPFGEIPKGEGVEMETMSKFMDGILGSLVDRAVHRVDVANFTQMAIHQIHRSGGSELFWHDMTTSCGIGLFGRDPDFLDEEVQSMFVVTFAVLSNLVKVASGKIRTNALTYELRARDVSSKILSLELLIHFLEQYQNGQQIWLDLNRPQSDSLARCVETMIFSVRRLVVPCILSNTRAGLEEPRVFQRMMKIISLLWRTPMYRDRMKGELGILFEHFALRILRLGPQLQQSRTKRRTTDLDDLSCPLLTQQLDVLSEIKRWFTTDPKSTIEMYLNYDTDITSQGVAGPMPLLPGTQWKVFQRLCAGLCNLTEQCGDLIGEQIRQSQSTATHAESVTSKLPGFMDPTSEAQSAENKETRMAEMKAIREGARRLRKAALDAIVQILKCLARTSAVATGRQFYALVSSWSDPNDPDDIFKEDRLPITPPPIASNGSDSDYSDTESDGRITGPGGVLSFWQKEITAQQKTRPFTYNYDSQSGLLSSVTRETAFEIAKKKSVKKAVEYLIACNALTPSPRDIASFLRVHKDMLDQEALGQYLGETGIDGQETEYWNLIRFSYVRAISFDGMKVEEALRHFLTNCGFQLPGEAQKVDRIMSTFAQCYWEDNAGDLKNCPFQDQDTVFLLSFAIIMLNTDLHKSGLPANSTSRTSSRGGRRRISKQEFLKNLSGVEGGEDLKREYLSAVYDSIEANPIVLTSSEAETQSHVASSAEEERDRMLKGMLGNVRSADALLRGLSVHDVKWASMQDFSSSLEYEGAEALSDLTQSCISKAWHQFHGVINTALETAHLDPQGMEPCVDLLKYALVVTICLDLPMERAAFLSQLGRFKVFEGNLTLNQGHWVPDAEQGRQLLLQGNPAFDRAIAGPLDDESKLKALVQVHEATQDLKSALQVDIQVKQEMNRITHQILDGEFLLNDPSRSFLRMGDLKKKSNRSGRYTDYRFFLFSDVLIYAKRSSSASGANGKDQNQHRGGHGSFAENIDMDHNKDEYQIHEELPLHLMKVVDWFPPSSIKDVMKKAFRVHHPRKTFMVFCSSPEERIAWVRDIRTAIDREIKRKVEMEAARMAAATMSAPQLKPETKTPRLI